MPAERSYFENQINQTFPDRMVELVTEMLTLHENFPAAKTAHAKTALERQIAAHR